MNVGKLDQFVRVLAPINVPDDIGQIDTKYKVFKTLWAKKEELSTIRDNERLMGAQQRVAFGLAQFIFRYNPLIDATMIIECDGRYYCITGEVMETNRRMHTVVNTEPRDNQKVVII